MQQPIVEHVEGEAGAGERLRAAGERHLVAAGDGVDAEALLEQGEVLVELAEQLGDQPIVVEGDDDVRRLLAARHAEIGRRARRHADASARAGLSADGAGERAEQAVGAGLGR